MGCSERPAVSKAAEGYAHAARTFGGVPWIAAIIAVGNAIAAATKRRRSCANSTPKQRLTAALLLPLRPLSTIVPRRCRLPEQSRAHADCLNMPTTAERANNAAECPRYHRSRQAHSAPARVGSACKFRHRPSPTAKQPMVPLATDSPQCQSPASAASVRAPPATPCTTASCLACNEKPAVNR